MRSYEARGVGIYFAHLRPAQLKMFRIVGIPELLGPQRFHPDLSSAMQEVESLGFGSRIRGSRVRLRETTASSLSQANV